LAHQGNNRTGSVQVWFLLSQVGENPAQPK